MNGFAPNTPVGRQQDNRLAVLFQVVTAVSLTIMTGKLLLDMVNDHHRQKAGQTSRHR